MKSFFNVVLWGLIPGLLVGGGFGFWKGVEVGTSPQVRALISANEAAANVPGKVKEFFGGK